MLVVLALLAVAGCGSGGPKEVAQQLTSTASTPDTSSSSEGTTPPSTSAAPPPTETATTPPPTATAPALTGFGATDAEWNATHTDDLMAKIRGVAYDHDPTFGGGVSDKYLDVQHQDGRVLSYTLNLHAGTSLATAQRAAAAELPADAVILWTATKDGCEQTEMTSKTLGLALSDPAIGDPTGEVNIEFATGEGYDPGNVTEALISTGNYPTPSDGPPC
jgi:hypothetical protein